MSAACSQIVHRDVKAPNVLLREADGCYDACISDFGTVFQPPTLRGFKGTPASMSPEQLKVAPPLRFRTMDVALVGRGCGLRTLSPHARPSHGRRGTPRVV
jgi:serine/threonine protein kinase